MAQTKTGKNRIWLAVVLFLVSALIGVGIMVYPLLASQYAEKVRSEIQTHYEEVLVDTDTSQIDAVWAAAEQYNAKLFAAEISPLTPQENGYYDQLRIEGAGIMCYVEIPRIGVKLPVYHGIGETALHKGAGHMPQSSLPVGGENTHSVISAHTGMAGSPMFTDLELMEIGDLFFVETLGKKMAYTVTEMQVVLPNEVTAVQIQRGEDLATLVTCTPYGVNSHRLLVTGKRTELPEENDETRAEQIVTVQKQESVWVTAYWHSIKIGAIIAGACLGFVLLLLLILRLRKKKRVSSDAGQV